jgi:uncharacterized protein YukE
MNSKVFVDPAQIREFSSDLRIFQERVTDYGAQLRHNLSQLSDTWQDQEFDAFSESFEVLQYRLAKFIAEIEEALPKLAADADRGDEMHSEKAPAI